MKEGDTTMHKVRNLAYDEVMKRAVELDENKDYRKIGVAIPASPGTVSDCEAVKDALLTLVAQRKLDHTDIAIILARDCSPMPTEREVAAKVGIDQAAAHRRVIKIRSMLAAFSP